MAARGRHAAMIRKTVMPLLALLLWTNKGSNNGAFVQNQPPHPAAERNRGAVVTMNNQGNAVRLYMLFFNRYPYYFTIPTEKYATLYKKLKSYVKVKVLYPQINYFGGSATIKINDVIANRQLLPDYVYAK